MHIVLMITMKSKTKTVLEKIRNSSFLMGFDLKMQNSYKAELAMNNVRSFKEKFPMDQRTNNYDCS